MKFTLIIGLAALMVGALISVAILHHIYRTPEAIPLEPEDVEPEPIPVYDWSEEGVTVLG